MIVINDLELLDILALIKRKQGRYIALLLNDVEEIIGDDQKTYTKLRKIMLDFFNDYTRSIFRILVGEDIEGLTFR